MLMVRITKSVGYAHRAAGLTFPFPPAQNRVDIPPTAGVTLRCDGDGLGNPFRRVLFLRGAQLLRDAVPVGADVLLV